MPISERINNWVENRSLTWGDRLKNWFSDAWRFIWTKILITTFPPANLAFIAWVNKTKDDPKATPEQRAFANEIAFGTKEQQAWAAELLGVIGAIPGLLAVGKPQATLIEYAQELFIRSARLDPNTVVTAWRREPALYNKYFDDLRDQGWSEERIETFKFVTQVIPNAADIVRFALREVYSPEIAREYGQFEDIPTDAYGDAAKAGLPADMFDKYWAAHWGLPSASDGFEMLHRGILTEEQLKGLLKANDIMPYWRDQLIKLSWNVPTRVDVRRFWEMRTIDEARLREIYTALGYHGRDLDDYVLWTKIYVDFPDLITRFKNGWLTLDDLRAELLKIGLSADRAEELIQTKVKAAASEKLAKDKDLTAAEIVKGVKKEVITYDQGLELLQELGYDEWEAEFKLAIEVAVATGSPESYEEFRDLTDKFRLATSLPKTPMTEELRKLGTEVIRLTAEVRTLQRSIEAEQGTLVDIEGLPQAATARLTELRATLYRAQAELNRVKTDYNAKITEWRRSVR